MTGTDSGPPSAADLADLDTVVAATNHERYRTLVEIAPRLWWPRVRAQASRLKSSGDAAPPPGTHEHASPGVPRLLLNFARAVAADPAILTGAAEVVDDAAFDARHARCRSCDLYRPGDDRCSHPDCGCHLTTRPGGSPGKARLASQHCPLGRWPGDPPIPAPEPAPCHPCGAARPA